MSLGEIMPEMFVRSRRVNLDEEEILGDTAADDSILRFFAALRSHGVDPTLPQHRQGFNNLMLAKTGARYLIGKYGEDRRAMLAGSSLAEEGRTIHLGLDIFSKDLEPVLAPCAGQVIRADREPGDHSFGNYLIFEPFGLGGEFYFFIGHLSDDWPAIGEVRQGEEIARLGDFENGENGGWSRHLHLQVLRQLPPHRQTPQGYATAETFRDLVYDHPNPMSFFPGWQVE